MSEQIREQVSAFLDGELPRTETELLLKRLTRDPELRESFGRYALIGEAMRGTHRPTLSRGFSARVNAAIDGEALPVAPGSMSGPSRWWRPFAGAAMVASVAAVAVIALQHRALGPTMGTVIASNSPATMSNPVRVPVSAQTAALSMVAASAAPREPLSYTTPASSTESAPLVATVPPGRMANYVFAHSKYSSGLGRRGVLTDLLIEDDAPQAARPTPVSVTTPAP